MNNSRLEQAAELAERIEDVLDGKPTGDCAVAVMLVLNRLLELGCASFPQNPPPRIQQLIALLKEEIAILVLVGARVNAKRN